jgi:Cu/Ag efflux protein CusF
VARVHLRPQQETIALLIAAASLVFARSEAATPAAQATPAKQARAHVLHGVVQNINTGSQTVTVVNDNIPGWMASMAMSYRVGDPTILSTLKASDRITATVYDGDVGRLYDVRIERSAEPAALSLPPLSYVCPSVGEEGVIDDKPGVCPRSGQTLVPIRLTIAYSCLHGPRFLQATRGTCTYDKSSLVPVTASVFWTCVTEPSKRYLTPGSCAGGAPRQQQFEIRPHGDHNPRHGGISVFMSEDLRNHLEATFVSPGLFRVYFYDEYTRPVRASGFTARVSIADDNGNEITPSAVLVWQREGAGNIMQVRIGNVAAPTPTSPLNLKLHVTVTSTAKDWVTDHRFVRYSEEPRKLAPSVRKSVGNASIGTVDPVTASLPFTMKQDALPSTAAALLALLAERAASLESLVKDGNLTAAWFPAIGSKDVALELETHHLDELMDGRRAEMASATRRLTLAAWQIDAAGDLGNRERLIELTRDFTRAVTEIQLLYAAAK